MQLQVDQVYLCNDGITYNNNKEEDSRGESLIPSCHPFIIGDNNNGNCNDDNNNNIIFTRRRFTLLE